MSTLLMPSLDFEIKDLICTSEPYYALQNLRILTDTLFECEVEMENLNYGEGTPISASESGRHLAILGSCALAHANPVKAKHYYLACEANLTRSPEFDTLACMENQAQTRFIARAEVNSMDHNTGKVTTSISTPEGQLIFDLSITYRIMKERTFEKMFRSNYQEVAAGSGVNPYTRVPDINNVRYNITSVSGELGGIKSADCAGHFDHYPALSIAILSSAFSELGGKHLKYLLRNENLKYAVRRSIVTATKLTFAGENVRIRSSLIYKRETEYTFKIYAENDQRLHVGEIEITFDVLDI